MVQRTQTTSKCHRRPVPSSLGLRVIIGWRKDHGSLGQQVLWLPKCVHPFAPRGSARWPNSQSQHLYASASGPSGGWVLLCERAT